MSYAELISEIKKLELEEIRNQSGKFFEFVIRTNLSEGLYPILERFFGAASKPAGQAPSKDIAQAAALYGGIRKDQTLFQINRDKISSYAMLWPWANGLLLTVKIFQVPQKS